VRRHVTQTLSLLVAPHRNERDRVSDDAGHDTKAVRTRRGRCWRRSAAEFGDFAIMRRMLKGIEARAKAMTATSPSIAVLACALVLSYAVALLVARYVPRSERGADRLTGWERRRRRS